MKQKYPGWGRCHQALLCSFRARICASSDGRVEVRRPSCWRGGGGIHVHLVSLLGSCHFAHLCLPSMLQTGEPASDAPSQGTKICPTASPKFPNHNRICSICTKRVSKQVVVSYDLTLRETVFDTLVIDCSLIKGDLSICQCLVSKCFSSCWTFRSQRVSVFDMTTEIWFALPVMRVFLIALQEHICIHTNLWAWATN